MNDLLFGPLALHEAYLARAISGKQEAVAALDPIKTGSTAIVPLNGVLTPRGVFGTSTARFADQVSSLADNPKISAIIIDIASPGGLVFGTQEAGDAVYAARSKKPVIAVANPYAASAAYWIGSQASEFYVTPSGEVGSIGVYRMHEDFSQYMENLGIKMTLVSAGEKKVYGNPYEPLEGDALDDEQRSVDKTYDKFVQAVSRGRGVTRQAVQEGFGLGAMVNAEEALNSNMVDGIQSLKAVVEKFSSARSRLNLMRRKAQVQGKALAV